MAEEIEMLREAEQYLAGFMGSSSSYKKVEALRERIRAHLAAQPQSISFPHEVYLNGIRFDAGEYLITRVSDVTTDPEF